MRFAQAAKPGLPINWVHHLTTLMPKPPEVFQASRQHPRGLLQSSQWLGGPAATPRSVEQPLLQRGADLFVQLLALTRHLRDFEADEVAGRAVERDENRLHAA
jgi:hypothetical protein